MKSEIRNPKPETNPKPEIPNPKGEGRGARGGTRRRKMLAMAAWTSGLRVGSCLLKQSVDAIGGALGTGTHRVGLVVADKLFLDRVPAQLATQLH